MAGQTFYVWDNYGVAIVSPSSEFWLEPDVKAGLIAEIDAEDYAHAVAEWEAHAMNEQAKAAQ